MSAFDAKSYWDSRLSQATGLADVGYSGLGQPFNAWMYRVRRRVFTWAVAPHLSEIKTAIDIGSGSGFYIERWRELGVPDVRGCDLAAPAVDRLRRAYPQLEFAQLDISGDQQDLPEWRADAISAFDVTFHIVDDERFERALRNVFTLLKPGGVFLFTDNFVHGSEQRLEHHVSRECSSIESVLQRAGFEILSRRASFVLMNEPVDRPRPAHRRAWSKLTRTLAAHPRLGHPIGATMYPLELAAVRFASDGPSTELMICRRPPPRP